MNTPKLGSSPSQETQLVSAVYKHLMMLKVSHFATTSFAQHEALGKTYDALEGLADDLTEKLIGYSGKSVDSISVGTVLKTDAGTAGASLVLLGDSVTKYGTAKNFGDIQNLGQEMSGLGAKLVYLNRLK